MCATLFPHARTHCHTYKCSLTCLSDSCTQLGRFQEWEFVMPGRLLHTCLSSFLYRICSKKSWKSIACSGGAVSFSKVLDSVSHEKQQQTLPFQFFMRVAEVFVLDFTEVTFGRVAHAWKTEIMQIYSQMCSACAWKAWSSNDNISSLWFRPRLLLIGCALSSLLFLACLFSALVFCLWFCLPAVRSCGRRN